MLVPNYSVAQFDHITTFEVLYCSTSIKGGAHMHSVKYSSVFKYVPHPYRKYDGNTQRNNAQFLPRTATYVIIYGGHLPAASCMYISAFAFLVDDKAQLHLYLQSPRTTVPL